MLASVEIALPELLSSGVSVLQLDAVLLGSGSGRTPAESLAWLISHLDPFSFPRRADDWADGVIAGIEVNVSLSPCSVLSDAGTASLVAALAKLTYPSVRILHPCLIGPLHSTCLKWLEGE